MNAYFFLYDNFLSDRRYDRVLAEIETRLTDLGITGKIGRLTPFTNAKGLVRDESRRGAGTIVAVGNDETVAKVVQGIGDGDVALGILPLGTPVTIAESLGVPPGAEACETLSRRVIQRVDMGSVNGQMFLSEVRIPAGHFSVEGDGKFRITPQDEECEIVISNLRSPSTALNGVPTRQKPGDPQDGRLDVLVVPKHGGVFRAFRSRSNGSTVIPLKRLTVKSEEPVKFMVDGLKMAAKEIIIEIIPNRLKVITGKQRLFGE